MTRREQYVHEVGKRTTATRQSQHNGKHFLGQATPEEIATPTSPSASSPLKPRRSWYSLELKPVTRGTQKHASMHKELLHKELLQTCPLNKLESMRCCNGVYIYYCNSLNTSTHIARSFSKIVYVQNAHRAPLVTRGTHMQCRTRRHFLSIFFMTPSWQCGGAFQSCLGCRHLGVRSFITGTSNIAKSQR